MTRTGKSRPVRSDVSHPALAGNPVCCTGIYRVCDVKDCLLTSIEILTFDVRIGIDDRFMMGTAITQVIDHLQFFSEPLPRNSPSKGSCNFRPYGCGVRGGKKEVPKVKAQFRDDLSSIRLMVCKSCASEGFRDAALSWLGKRDLLRQKPLRAITSPCWML